jgi:hypothetical protein
MSKIRFQRNFILKIRKRTEQGCDKRMYQKLVLNILKVMGNFAFIYTHCSLKEISQKTSNLHVAHIHQCASMCEL